MIRLATLVLISAWLLLVLSPGAVTGSHICGVDMDGSGYLDSSEEIVACIEGTRGTLCPIGAVECQASYGQATCPPGGSLNGSTDICEASPEISCAFGYSYDPELDRCFQSPGCPGNGVFNTATDKCELLLTDASCPSGYSYSSGHDACLKEVVCPSEGVYSPARDRCELSPRYLCPEEYAYSLEHGKCEVSPNCTQGTYDIDYNRCEKGATAECPAGYTYSQSLETCVTKATCPGDGVFSGASDKCEVVATPTCPSGYSFNGSINKCQRPPFCPSETTYDSSVNKCVVASVPVCSSQFSYESSSSTCYRAASCPAGNLNEVRDTCESAPGYNCPPGYGYNAPKGKCEAPPECPSESSYSSSADICVQAAEIGCPSRYSYSSSSEKCERSPDCPSGGSYSVINNRCEMGKTWTCPADGKTYGSEQTCNNNCTKKGSCNNTGSELVCRNMRAKCAPWASSCCYIDVGCLGDGRVKLYYHDCCGYGWTTYVSSIDSLLRGQTVAPAGTYVQCSSNGACYFYMYNYYCSSPYRGWYIWTINLGSLGSRALYTCSLTGNSYSNLQDCNTNCTQGESCTGSCLPDYTSAGDFCIRNPICSSGGTLDGSRDRCQITPTYSCPTGFSYDTALRACARPTTCSSGGVLNSGLDLCEIASTINCPSGYSFNSSSRLCERAPECLTGSTYHTSRNRCEASPTHTCQSGTNYDSESAFCTAEAFCQTGGLLNPSSDLCELLVSYSCPSGYTYNSSAEKCERAPFCEAGGSYTPAIDQCAAANTWGCPLGMSYDEISGRCIASASCPGGGGLNGVTELCEAAATPECEPGYSLRSEEGMCPSEALCSGGVFDPTIDRCKVVAASLCPTGYSFSSNSEKCQKTPTCSGVGTYSPAADVCVDEAEYQCPFDYTFASARRLCESPPACEAGTYESGKDSCYEGDNNCPLGSQYACLESSGSPQCSPNECVDLDTSPPEDGHSDQTGYQDDGEVDPDTGECQGEIFVFNGEGGECRPSGWSTSFFNCCNASSDSFLMLQKACKEGEIRTVQAKRAKRAHYIGNYCKKKVKFIGCIQKAEVYCLFNSQLARIIHEQGRPQLQAFAPKGKWGDAESPNCRGFRPEEFQMLDFAKMDLSEYFGEIQMQASQKLQQEMTEGVNDFYQGIR